jgi:hypothetical protein
MLKAGDKVYLSLVVVASELVDMGFDLDGLKESGKQIESIKYYSDIETGTYVGNTFVPDTSAKSYKAASDSSKWGYTSEQHKTNVYAEMSNFSADARSDMRLWYGDLVLDYPITPDLAVTAITPPPQLKLGDPLTFSTTITSVTDLTEPTDLRVKVGTVELTKTGITLQQNVPLT